MRQRPFMFIIRQRARAVKHVFACAPQKERGPFAAWFLLT